MKTSEKWQNHGVDEKNKRGPWTQTYLGGRFHPNAPLPGDVYIRDVAAALSKLCRFNGHVSHFYSVAQHSVLMVRMVEPEYQLEALLHDAAEAYIGDMVRPLKVGDEYFKEVDDRVDAACREAFGLPPEMSAQVHDADMRICSAEKRDLMPRSEVWPNMPPSDGIPTITPWGWKYAERKFLDTYRRLRGLDSL